MVLTAPHTWGLGLMAVNGPALAPIPLNHRAFFGPSSEEPWLNHKNNRCWQSGC